MTVKHTHSVQKIRIGTRGSPLALRQAEMVCAELVRVQPEIRTEIVIIKTSGDWIPAQGESPLDRAGGGKALFAKEIEEQLLAGTIDAAVHSMKDMESVLPEGLMIAAMLPREDARDAMVLREKNPAIRGLSDLPENSIIGTCSLRRQGMLLAARPDLKVETLRGNVETRLAKLQAGKMAGILLAGAGLNRLNLSYNIDFMIPENEMIPAVGQGTIGIEIKGENNGLLSIFGQINCGETFMRVNCERAALAELGGSCHTPVGVYAVLEDGDLHLKMRLVSPDGTENFVEEGGIQFYITQNNGQSQGVALGGALSQAMELGRSVGRRLREKSPTELLG